MGKRMVSVDVFRGLTMAAMVIVNTPGDWGNIYWPLEHAEWNGWTPTDLVFPFFLFIVGVAITLSNKSTSAGSILRRAAVIAGLGLLLAGLPHFDIHHWRIPGVLQRIAVCYLAAGFLYKLTSGQQRLQRGSIMIGAAVVLCGVYWFVMTRVPNPAGVAGDLSPDGNWGAYIDRAVFGSHLWASSKTWDPEGLLGTIPSIATALFGVACGLWLGSAAPPARKTALLAAAGVAGIAIGCAWHPSFPINKKLWTSSFVFFTGGAAAMLLAVCYWAIDVMGWRGWTKPFVILGVNAIALYAASALLEHILELTRAGPWIYQHAFLPFAPPRIASLGYAIANLVVLFALLAWMYRRRWFLRA
jgi:predicted acyltransferase